ncbi:hypothetical protein MUY35_09190 [Aliiroseovarius sp. S1339]|uniref:hypothetical protein n=1 Tax=Aliiroseovarius sp. S1339 TaxID=2936990 RepID=UPI0020C173B5|nr:hypothetical protein [Aliiroseovarius sp. S1339]MCK8464022.1 hypothetical protein [Aliiroseovarius sp. S1339]
MLTRIALFVSFTGGLLLGTMDPLRAHGIGNNSVTAQSDMCGCNPLPLEGTYNGPSPMQLSFVSGTANSCPTQIRITTTRPGGPDPNIILTCDKSTQKWTGKETMPKNMGDIIWELSPIASMSQFPGSFSASDMAAVTLKLPPKLHAIGKADRTVNVVAESGKAAPCLCRLVELEKQHVESYIAANTDLSLIAHAQATGMNGADERTGFWMDSQRRLHKAAGNQALSFADLVTGVVDGTVTVAPDGTVSVSSDTSAQSTANAADYSTRTMQPNSLAETDVRSCKITLPSAASAAAECIPDIVLTAAYEHESQHQATCEALHSVTTYKAPDGTLYDWIKDKDTLGDVRHEGVRLPVSGYAAWSADPVNQANDEAGAYTEELNVLNGWLSKYCP